MKIRVLIQLLKRSSTLLGALFLIPLFIILFQNCSPSKLTSDALQLYGASGGNGWGYDGKIFVMGSCNDTSPKKRAILNLANRTATVTRDNCAEVVGPQSVLPIEHFDEKFPQTLTLQGQVFTDEQLARRVDISCQGLEDGMFPFQVNFWNLSTSDPRAEVLRWDPGQGINLSTGEHNLDILQQSTNFLNFNSQQSYQGGNTLLTGVLSNGRLSVNYMIPSLGNLNTETGVPCTIN